MKLYAKCINCKADISFRTWNSTRVDFKKTKKERIELTCPKCKHKEKYHIDDIYARESKVILLIGLIVFTVGPNLILIFLWDYLLKAVGIYPILGLTILLIVPSWIYAIISKNESQRVRNFNWS